MCDLLYTPIELSILDDAAEDEEDAIDAIMALDDDDSIDSVCTDDELEGCDEQNC